MRLILIHGRAQQGKDPVKLKEIWIDSLKESLSKNGLELPGELDIRFPYYGDRLDDLVNNKELQNLKKDVITRGVDSDQEAQFFYDFLNEVADNAKIEEEAITKNYEGDVLEKGNPLNWEWIQAILRTIDEETGFGNEILKAFTYDVFMYLTKPGIMRVINTIIESEVDNNPCVVVGHSLGTIIGYNILRKNGSANVKKYVTLGSPLGLKSIKNRLETPLVMPPCIKGGWFNAYDEEDYVALNPLDKSHFNIIPSITNKNDVKNRTDSRHGIEGYLDDKEVARVIYDSLTSQ